MTEDEEMLSRRVYRTALVGDKHFWELYKESAHLHSHASSEGIFAPASPLPLFGSAHPPEPVSGAAQSLNAVHEFLGRFPGIIDLPLDPPAEYLSSTEFYQLFRLQNWVRLPVESMSIQEIQVWEATAPARALATKFLTTPEMQPFWYRLAFGEPFTTQNGKRYFGRSHWEDNPSAAQEAFGAMLDDMASKLRFWWCPETLEDGSVIEGLFNRSRVSVMESLDEKTAKFMSLRVRDHITSQHYDVFIGLSSRYLYHLLSPKSSVRTDKSAMMRLQFDLAVTLCHEIAHAVYAYRGLQQPEMFVCPTDEMAESGFSWTFNVLGACVDISSSGNKNVDRDVKYMLSKDWKSMWAFPRIRMVVDMHWINAWFRRDTWERIDEVMQHEMLKLPYMSGFPGPRFWAADRFCDGPDGQWY